MTELTEKYEIPKTTLYKWAAGISRPSGKHEKIVSDFYASQAPKR